MYNSLKVAVKNDLKGECASLCALIPEWLADMGFDNKTGGNARAYTLTLAFDPSVEGQGYIFSCPDNFGEIRASCLAGLYAGAGYFLLNSRITDGALTPADAPAESYPAKQVRGMYFATHFHNYYHDAPLADVLRYVGELALWGYNSLCVWFDMHHYSGMDDPAAIEMVERLRAILKKAQDSGMSPCLGVLANEGFSSTPDALKADWRAGRNGYHSEPAGHYHVEICPNEPGGMDLILKNRDDMCRAFDGINLKYTWIWPYDQGGCTCSKCAPWGSEGFLKTAPLVAGTFKKYFPGVEVILSVWDFDEFISGETEDFKQKFLNEGNYADYILCEPRGQYDRLPIRGGEIRSLPVVGFPEISMRYATPLGGFGANPLPRYIRHLWNVCKTEMAGGYPYSEGIFEDINKFVVSRMYWHGDYSVHDALEDYARAYFSAEHAADISRCLTEMEITLERAMVKSCDNVDPYAVFSASGRVNAKIRHVLRTPAFCGHVYDEITKCDAVLPRAVRNSWRWRIVYLRALIDRELSSNDFYETPACRGAFNELIEIYHAQNAEFAVRPPVSE